VIAHTAKAYMGLLLAKKRLGVIGQAVETARAHLAFIESRYQEGVVVKSDLLRAQVRLAGLEQEHLAGRSQVSVARAALNAAMGNSDNPPLETLTPLTKGRAPQGSLTDWIEKGHTDHPEILRLDLMKRAAEARIRQAKAGDWPSVHLMGAYDWDTEDFSSFGDSYTVGAVARLNLYRGGGVRAGVLAATAVLKRTRELENATRLRISMKTRQAYSEAQSAWERIAVAQSALKQAEEGLRIVENRYRNGLLPLVALLDAEMARREARMNHFKALHDYRVARVDLMAAAGSIDREWQE
jgi:outer membrane protein TolC